VEDQSSVVAFIWPCKQLFSPFTHLEDRAVTPIIDKETGQQKGWTKAIGVMPLSAEYAFLDLYEDGVQTLRHYVVLLERLDAIPRFGPEALSTAVGE
jgi:hypothetical protein